MAYLEVRTQKIGCVNHDCDECKAKAQRTWVGLTDEEREAAMAGMDNRWDIAKSIEDELKEKNT